jgi:hypothetical protein
MDKVRFRNVTIWAIYAHVTLLVACIANAAIVLVGHTIPCNFLSMLASEPCSWRRVLPWLVSLRSVWPTRHQSDQWHAPV